MLQRSLEYRSKKSIVHGDGWATTLLSLANHLRHFNQQREIHEPAGRIGWRLRDDQCHATLCLLRKQKRLLRRIVNGCAIASVLECDRANPECRQRLFDQSLGAAIEGLADEQDVAGSQIRPQGCRYGGHPARKDSGRRAAFPECEPVLEHFQVGIVETGIDQPRLLAFGRMRRPEVTSKKSLPSCAVSNQPGEGRKMGGFRAPSDK